MEPETDKKRKVRELRDFITILYVTYITVIANEEVLGRINGMRELAGVLE